MLTESQKKAIIRNIPDVIDIDGYGLKIAKRYGNQFNYDVFPACVLSYTELSEFRGHWPIINNLYDQSNESYEAHYFRIGTLVYTLDVEQPDDLEEVTGIVGGNPYTFVIGETEDVFLTSTRRLEFTGTTLPDNNTQFRARYKHRAIKSYKGNEVNDKLTVDVYAEDIDKRDESGPFINGVKLVDRVADMIHFWFRYTEAIYGQDGERIHITMKTESLVRNLDQVVESNYRRRRQFEVYIAHLEATVETVPTIETVDWDFQNVYP